MALRPFKSVVAGLALGVVLNFSPAGAATLTVQTNVLGPTPVLMGYNLGHFYPGSNTRDWWRYAGVNGARIFDSPSSIEPSDDLPPVGDGVTSQAGFLNRKAALRADPLNPAYINWPYFTNHFETTDLYPVNHIKANFALGELRKLGVQICAQITASESRFPITGTNDWGGKWELWQHYYADAFYLGRTFDVQRYQMYNEPNGTSIASTNFLMRLQLVADAVQSAIADVNSLYGKNLRPQLLAPTAAGNATSAYVGWGDIVVTNRHTDFLGVTSPNFELIQTYDYHQYGASGAGFGTGLANLNALLAADMAPEAPYPISVSEFNARTAASYDSTTVTLDSPNDYSRFGSIAANLMANGITEMYAFKFSQVTYSGNYPVQKNAMYYVDNVNAPYNIGGVTKAGEIYRLFAKAFVGDRQRLNVVTDVGASGLDVEASYDAVQNCYHIFSANSTTSPVDLSVNPAALNLSATNKVLLEEVSEAASGGGVRWTTVGDAQTSLGTQPAYSAWLLTIPAAAQADEQDLAATDDAQVTDGANKNVNYGSASTMLVRNDPASANNRRVAFMKFTLPTNNLSQLQFAVLSLSAATTTLNTNVQAHVYGLTNTNWSQNSITWSNAPNLKQNVSAGALIANGFVNGQGTNLFILGQVVASSTVSAEKLVDVTDYLRGQTNRTVTLLVSQEPRWDVTLPSLTPGDTQPDGLILNTTESGNGPRLRLVFKQPTTPTVLTNLTATAEANIQGGTYANTNVNETTQGYLMVKYYASPFSSARKAYFQFDVTRLNLIGNTSAVFTVNFQAYYKQNVQLWALNQSYPNFNSIVTWNTAQANDTNSNDLLTTGAFTATAISAVTNIPVNSAMPQSFVIPQIGNYVQGNLLTLALTGVAANGIYTNDSGGLRLTPGSATLSVLVNPSAILPPQIAGVAAGAGGQFTLNFNGSVNGTYYVQATTNLAGSNWIIISTNTTDTNGHAIFTDATNNFPARFYRILTP